MDTTASLDIAIAPPVQQSVSVDGHKSASGMIIVDLASGQQVYGYHTEVRRPMASLTKLMTALIIAENHDMTELVTVPEWATRTEGTVAHLPAGEQFTVGDLLSALLISSANDAANVLAAFHSGDVESFVEEMNTRADALGMESTSYANPHGLDHPRQWSTPQDLAGLTAFVLQNEDIAERMATRGRRIWSRQGTPIDLTHTHNLMHAADSNVLAGKTGTTDGAGQCLISVVQEGDQTFLVVIMHSLQRYIDMRKVLEALVPPTPLV